MRVEKSKILQVGKVIRSPETDGETMITGWVFERNYNSDPGAFAIPADVVNFLCGGYTVEELETIAKERRVN